MDVRVGAVTVNVVEPVTPAALAVIVVVPWAVLPATPGFVESPLIGAVAAEDELHKTDDNVVSLPTDT
jgi:hypothetical protein